MGIGMCSQRRLFNVPGLKCGTGKYAKRQTDSDFDDLTDFTVLQFVYADGGEGGGGFTANTSTFSMWDGTDGIYTLQSGTGQNRSDYFLGKGTSGFGTSTANLGGVAGYEWGGISVTTQRDNGVYAWAYTFDASLSEDESKAFSWSLNKAEISDSDDNSESNLGTLGTSTDIRLGLWTSNGTNSNYNVNSGIKIGKTAIWKSALTQAELRLLVNYNGSTGSMIYDVSGRYGAAGYTALGVAQPNHEWIPKVDSAVAVTAIADTGSDGGKALSFVGSPKISFHGAY